MKITYRRELKHNYMIIEPEQEEEAEGAVYVRRILSENGIEGILRFQLRQMDGERQFYYEITSRQPLSRLLEGQSLRCGQIHSLVLGIARILDRMEQYLLPESCILLEPEYIYVEPDRFRVWLCLIPGLSRDFPEDYGKLLEYLLGKVDHQDKDSVVLAYGLYQETRKENYGMDDILRYLGREGCSKREGQIEENKITEDIGHRTDEVREPDCSLKMNSARKQEKEKPERKGWFQRITDWWKMRFWGEETEPTQVPWELMFETEPEQKEEWVRNTGSAGAVGNAEMDRIAEHQKNNLSEMSFLQNTVLLADVSSSGTMTCSHRLHSLDGETEDILIAYYPFVIGKQVNLVDYVLARDTVSRLHLRIDREENGYYVRDLNSTNGTAIGGRMLEANEKALLKEGEEVSIAGYRYRFE